MIAIQPGGGSPCPGPGSRANLSRHSDSCVQDGPPTGTGSLLPRLEGAASSRTSFEVSQVGTASRASRSTACSGSRAKVSEQIAGRLHDRRRTRARLGRTSLTLPGEPERVLGSSKRTRTIPNEQFRASRSRPPDFDGQVPAFARLDRQADGTPRSCRRLGRGGAAARESSAGFVGGGRRGNAAWRRGSRETLPYRVRRGQGPTTRPASASSPASERSAPVRSPGAR